MKTYQQEGLNLRLKPMMESGNICRCCDTFQHNAQEVHKLGVDDVECPECGMLCSCRCHLEKPAPPEPEPPKVEKPAPKRKAKKK